MFKRLWRRWLRIAEVIGNFQSRVILSLFYFTIVLPFGLAVRLFADPLRIRRKRESGWVDIPETPQTIEQGRRQF